MSAPGTPDHEPPDHKPPAEAAAAVPETPPADDPPQYWAWTDRWDPGKWETPENPTPLQRVFAGIALVIVLVMTVYVPLRVLNIL